MRLVRVDVDGEVEEVRDEEAGQGRPEARAGLEDVQPLHDQHVRPAHHLHRVREDVVAQVGVDRGGDLRQPGLDGGQEADQTAHVVRLGETLALQQPARFQHLRG